MKKIILTTPEELIELIESSVRKILNEKGEKSIPKEDNHYLTLPEAAIYIKRAPQTLYSYTSKRLIPFFKRENTKPLFFLKSDLDKWLSAGKKKSVSEINDDLNK
jgi:hypothetical protein